MTTFYCFEIIQENNPNKPQKKYLGTIEISPTEENKIIEKAKQKFGEKQNGILASTLKNPHKIKNVKYSDAFVITVNTQTNLNKNKTNLTNLTDYSYLYI